MSGKIDRQKLETAFDRMGTILGSRRTVGEIAIYGGSAIMLQFEYRESTHDVDCVVVSGHGAVMEAMMKVGRELSLGSGWLNEGVSIYTCRTQEGRDLIPYGQYPRGSRPWLTVSLAKPEYLLAMKVEALRRLSPRDAADVELIARGLSISTSEQIMAIHARYFGDAKVTLAMRQAVSGIVTGLKGGGNDHDPTRKPE